MKYLFIISLSYSSLLTAAYQITPGLKYNLIKLSKQVLSGSSLTHNYIQKITKKENYDQDNVTKYLKKRFYDFKNYSDKF